MKKLKRIPNLPEDSIPTIEDVQKDLGLNLMTFMSQMSQAPGEQIDEHDLPEVKSRRIAPSPPGE